MAQSAKWGASLTTYPRRLLRALPWNGLGLRGRWRLAVVWLTGSVWFLLVLLRLGDLQIRKGSDLSSAALRQQQGKVELRARRGRILDRHGAELALSTPVQSIGVFADRVEDPESLAAQLAAALRVDERDLLRSLSRGGFQWAKRLADLPDTERARALQSGVLHFETEPKRYYPHGTVGAHVLGTVGLAHVGQAGVEQRFDKQLTGQPGLGILQYDARQRRYGRTVLRPPVPGADLVLDLDLELQRFVHLKLDRAMRQTKSRAGTVVLMDPNSGEVLALASWPRFDPNRLSRTPKDLENLRNFAVSHLVEPGSTFKVLTAAAALEEGAVNVEDTFDCEMGAIWIDGRRIRDHHPYGLLTVPQVLMKSSNVGIIKIGYKLGEEHMAEYIRRFGFGRATGVALPGEVPGLVRPRQRWSGSSLASLAMGQEIGVNALQMARLFAAVANEGILVQPRIARSVQEHGRELVTFERKTGRRVLAVETAATMQAILERVVEDGTGRRAAIPGYRVAGKTGTAQMINPVSRSYRDGAYLASFCGFAPVEDPAVVGVVMLYDPQGQFYYGGQIAAPLFSTVMQKALRRLHVPPSEGVPRRPRPAAEVPAADLADFAAGPASPGGPAGELEPQRGAPSGPEAAAAPDPAPPAVQPVRALLVEDGRLAGSAVAPSFLGLTLGEAFSTAARLGVAIEASGSGLARHQSPAPNEALRPGQTVQLSFGLSLLEANGPAAGRATVRR